MKMLKMLILTDHSNHSIENSLYSISHALRKHPLCAQIDIASRGNRVNDVFFDKHSSENLFVTRVEDDFAFHPNGDCFTNDLKKISVHDYDFTWLRLPPPLTEGFLFFLKNRFPEMLFINDPQGIFKSGSKSFLVEFEDLCPPMKICQSIEEIINFKNQFPVVLKPFRQYGGRGIVRIDGDRVWEENEEMSISDFFNKIKHSKIEFLGVKFLKNVSRGDKRIVVVNGKIMGASIRFPAKDSWICNVSMGGNSNYAEVTDDEIKIVNRLNPVLSQIGVVMYGVDTLEDDNGKRVLSEINTTSIGGIPQIEKFAGKPVVQETADLIWAYCINKIKGNVIIDK
jgi:glutathione synthase